MDRHRRPTSRPGQAPAQWLLVATLTFSSLALRAQPQNVPSQQPRADSSKANQSASSTAPSQAVLPRGKKLVLKDGSFQLVREYKIDGDRVRYYSLDASQWEEIPASLIDWDKTKQIEADEASRDATLVGKVHNQEQARLIPPLDIDASIEAAPGVFLPPGEGVFAFDGKAILPVAPADPDFKRSKKREIEKVLSPIPIVPTRHFVLLEGTHAKVRLKGGQPEFYMRTTQERDPDLQLVAAKVHGASRQIANVDELFKMQQAVGKTLLMQQWEIAKGVYRFTLGQTLDAGEYALIEVVPGKTDSEQLSIYVWDFGVDSPPASPHKAN
jgi:hypothetical protein